VICASKDLENWRPLIYENQALIRGVGEYHSDLAAIRLVAVASDAGLGGEVIKQRIARPRTGKIEGLPDYHLFPAASEHQ
jgi:hypothetical protein